MKLHSVNREFAMLQPHDFTIVGFCSDDEGLRKAIAPDYEGMITSGFEGLRHVFKNTRAMVRNGGRFPVHQLRGLRNFAAVDFADTLVTQANAE